ncbi:efflux RND transporter permease subunit [Elioraea sp. Yellowstone]|jgi:multidrug efflux pump|uniref:efflux RND transporter permease subunit n=1 Tax=Elioraea sp. Yellowstone TaxID=2592070 RepID=UPI00114F1CC1|nr:efflux RND transporter permease subunit [Elioraea sp. Yellowstone]TQF83114.1 efflux RND transporter permease subunit [Elioraea sp. Yellowstone]
MVLSDVSIKRPVFATVMSLLVVVLGLAAFTKLPVRELPQIDPPIVSITTQYRGAAAPVVETQVTEIIEGAIAGIEGINIISSESRDERSRVVIEFRLTRDIDAAANDVRDRVARALTRLPDTADAPVVAKQDADARAILWVTLVSDRHTGMELTDIARTLMVDRLSTVDGVANVVISGERRFAMRIWLDRRTLAARGLTVEDVENAIRRENVELPGGRLESSAREFSVRTDTRLATPQQFRSIVVAQRGGTQVLLGDVARVEIAPEDDRGELRVMRQTGVGLGIQRQSTANTLSVANGVKAEVERLRPALPEGIRIVYGYDESLFIAQSIYEVFHALMIALSLVIGVIFLFLRSWRATIIPAVAIPVSIIGSFIALAALGFSLNVLTLLGMVLAIGIVVDDAIVVLENIHRRIEEGEQPLVAAFRGARQIAFAVVATTLVLVSVFLPISYLEGQTGRLFSEFGFALAASVLVSGFVALSLTPMMCSKLLRPHAADGRLVRWTEPAFVGLNRGFRWALERSLRAPILVLAGSVGVSLVAVALFVALPKEFAPVEDRGVVVVPITAPEGASFAYTREHVAKVEDILLPYVERGDGVIVFASIGGFGRPAISNTANVFLRLAPWQSRTVKQQDLTAEIFPKVAAIPGVRAFAVNPGSLGSRGFQAPIQFVLQGPDYDTLVQWRDAVMERLRESPLLVNIDSNFKETKPEMRVGIDRRRAADLGISIETIGRTIETMLGAREVGTYVERGNEYKVILQAEPADRATPHDLQNIFVRTRSGELVPLANLITLAERARPQSLNREDRLRSITVTASLAPGASLGEALEAVEAAAIDVLPPEARFTWRGQSREFKESSSALYVTFGLALLIVFLVLAAQFESFVHPFIILLSTPLAVTGGLAALYVLGLSLNIFSQIGLILLIGLMAKNGILVVEFANQLRDQGRAVREAVLEASVARLRPILMTTIATILGAWPLAAATGAGAESRQALGVVVIGGMGLSTLITLFAIPALYLLLAPLTRPSGEIARRLAAIERGAASPQPAE